MRVALLLAAAGVAEIPVHRASVPPVVAAWRASLAEGRPALRGFRPDVGEAPYVALPGAPEVRTVASMVSRDLARRGLLATTAAAVEALGTSSPDRLREVGLPVDWLEFFSIPGSGSALQAIGSAAASGATFAFRPTLPGFAVATESGEHEIGLVRLQIASRAYWAGPGDGGSLDVVRQLLEVLPGAEFVASVEEKNLEGALDAARTWKGGAAARLTIVAEPLPVSQWAQDDGKPGLAPAAGGGSEVVTLVPRYASRGEDGAHFLPGETFLADGLASAGHRIARSPLLFQGGDLLAVRDPKSGERVLLLGEANVWRNVALGLTRDQVLEAFRTELGVDRCQVLPAVSFHLDEEITCRAVGDKLVAFVADSVEAVRIVLRCGTGALESAGVLTKSRGEEARGDLEAGKDREFLALVVPAVSGRCTAYGCFPESLAASFSRGAADSGVGNLQRFLLACDLLASWSLPVDELELDPHSIAYLRSFRRRDEERRRLAADLRKSGFEVARVPSLPEGNRGIDYLNGVQDRTRYLMPAWGGLYVPLDEAAAAAFARALGPGVEVVPVLSSESQRRGGALHCSISVAPRPEPR
jgi:hypothetical protein